MQARNDEPDAPPVELDEVVGAGADDDGDDDAGVLVPADGALDVLLPQAATSRLAAAAAAVVINAVCFTVSSTGTRLCRCPGVTGLPPRPRLPED
jgi:hypothetical protein